MDDFGRLWNMKSVIPLMYEKSAPQGSTFAIIDSVNVPMVCVYMHQGLC